MITEKVARERAQLVQFRAQVHGTFQRRADAVFELIDALASNSQARSPVELSLSRFFRREYASLYDGLDAWQYDALTLDQVLLDVLSQPAAGGFRLWAVDETPRPRRFAPTVADRGYVHYPNAVGNNKPITIGYNYAVLAHVDVAGPNTWAPPFAVARTPTTSTGVDLALGQIVCLVRYDDGWHVVAADSRYGTPLYIAGLHQLPNVTGVTRLGCRRNLYRPAPPYSGFGRPCIHGDVFKLHDATTWGEPDEQTEFTEQDAKKRSLRVVIEAWRQLHFREAPHCPFTLVKVTTYRANGQLRFKHPLWLVVTHRHSLSLPAIRAAYLRRPTIEHFNRFVKQRLLFEAAQMGSVEQDERWAQVVKLAYWQLYASRNLVERSVRPWERYKPKPAADQPATPSQAQRGFSRLLLDLGTPAQPPQPRGKSPGRPKGNRPGPRKRFPVVYKGQKQADGVT